MIIYANAKINLALDVVGLRDDGYHETDMIMQEIDLCDKLEIELSDSGSICLECDRSDLGNAESNIAYKAAKLFLNEFAPEKGCKIKLFKNIPVCAGLGGGSADAAAVLKGLNELCGFPANTEMLKKLGLKLGADVPFCIIGATARARGIGEVLTPVCAKKEKWLVLIKPNINISTGEAYHKIDTANYPHLNIQKAVDAIEAGNMEELYALCGNSFEYVTGEEYPEIGRIKQYLKDKGAEFAMMSGSGPTVFGIFESERSAKDALSECPVACESAHVSKFVIKSV